MKLVGHVEKILIVILFFIIGYAAIPTIQARLLKRKTNEAYENLDIIYNAQVKYYHAHSAFVQVTSPSPRCAPAKIECGSSRDFKKDGWDLLRLDLEGPFYFQYTIDVETTDRVSFTVSAIGDLDGDGTTSSFVRNAWVNDEGTIEGTPVIKKKELE